MVDSLWFGMHTKILGEKDGPHTNHPGWLVTVRHSTTGLEVARSFGRLSTWGFGLRLHRLNPCHYTMLHGGWGIHWSIPMGFAKLVAFHIISRYFQRIQEFTQYPQQSAKRPSGPTYLPILFETCGCWKWIPFKLSISFNNPMFYKYRLPKNNQQTDWTKWNCQVPWASPMVVLCPWRVAWLWRRCPRPYDAWRWVAGGVRRSATWGSNPIGERRFVVVSWKRLVGQSDQQKSLEFGNFFFFKALNLHFFGLCSSCVIVRSHSLTFSEVKRKHLNFERDWNLHPPRSWLSDDVGPGISVEAWKVAWLNNSSFGWARQYRNSSRMHIVHTYHDL